ncbi:hypothetical Protein YC6258_03683 [Gynuella sunshinyii YC6258]|uniref:Uncharacterized protein n=1 Tax=Gynuella sunshinyii YC6258 TaxID=1445510 RepID=A0A0C5VZ76_9GAMM|nr:hypothetical Protein YC6258_03683 [Gynuella sunshinyii YC6258]
MGHGEKYATAVSVLKQHFRSNVIIGNAPALLFERSLPEETNLRVPKYEITK